MPKVSIITIVLNNKDLIAKTIESVGKQTFRDFEYIVVDGASTDGTLDVIKSYPSIVTRFISEKDKGISDAFNKGIQMAQGEIIGIINAGDWYEPDAIETAVKAFESSDCGVFVAAMNYLKDGKLVYVIRSKFDVFEKRMSLVHPSTFVKKSVYEKLGTFDLSKKIAMDYDLLLRFHVNHVPFYISEKTIVNMIDGGVSALSRVKGQKEVLDIRNKYLGQKWHHYVDYYWRIFLLKTINSIKKYGFSFVLNLIRPIYARIFKYR